VGWTLSPIHRAGLSQFHHFIYIYIYKIVRPLVGPTS
jgi:hypothetical protein